MGTVQHIRDNLLLQGLAKPVALNAVDWRVKQQHPCASDSEVQHETLEVIRTLVDDGLFRLGDLDRQEFTASKRSLNRSLDKISRRYVRHYENPQGWMYSAWMNLTPKGEQVATALEELGVDSYRTPDMASLKRLRDMVTGFRLGDDLLTVSAA